MAGYRNAHRRRGIAVTLALVGGYVDAVGYLTLNLFTAHMSGNSTRLGVHLGRGDLGIAVPSAFAVAVFVLSIAVGTAGLEVASRARLRSPAAIVIGTEMLLLAGFLTDDRLGATHGPLSPAHPARYYGMAALAVAAMGLQTASLQRVSGHTVRTTFVSGTLTNVADHLVNLAFRSRQEPRTSTRDHLADHLVLPGPRRSRSALSLDTAIWCTYLSGAVLGTVLHEHLHVYSLAVPLAALLAVVAADLRWPTER